MIERLVLSAGDVVLNEGVMHEGVVVIEGKTIAGLYHTSEFTPLESDRVIDCSERFICPGFIDLHNQGGGGYTVMNSSFSNIQGLSKVHASHGTTGLLLTPLIENAGTGVYRRPPLSLIPKLADMVGKDTGGAAILGIHAEGPFVNPEKTGCMPHTAVHEPSSRILDEILESGNGKIVEMTIAPELPGALELILKLSREDVIASLGHSNATLTEVLRAIDHGASHVTHFFNAMSPLNHREPGLAGAALYSTDLTVEIIADGFHLHPWIMGLIVQNKSVTLTCLITDAMPAMGLEDGTYESMGMNVKLERGRLSLADNPDVLAGSVLSMDRAVANMINMVGFPIADAVAMASTTPAAVLGLHNRKGRLVVGFDADIAVLDRRYNNQLTIVGGNVVYSAERTGK